VHSVCLMYWFDTVVRMGWIKWRHHRLPHQESPSTATPSWAAILWSKRPSRNSPLTDTLSATLYSLQAYWPWQVWWPSRHSLTEELRLHLRPTVHQPCSQADGPARNMPAVHHLHAEARLRHHSNL
jgi:hypothetical protein